MTETEARTVVPFVKNTRNAPPKESSDTPQAFPFEKNIRTPGESAVETAPKDESAQEYADSLDLKTSDELSESATPAQEPVSKESGKDNDETEEETKDLPPANSLQSSSSGTNPGWSAPPVPPKPPMSE